MTGEMEIFTIGHSTRAFDDFLALLREAGVEALVDVRTVPRSRRNPQFAGESLARTLPPAGIEYVHMPRLGGLRKRPAGAPPSPNSGWKESGFRNFADYALTGEFAAGLEELVRLAERRPSAIMCAEAVWWRCHRRIITDHLLARGVCVRHILGPGKIADATPTPFARIDEEGGVLYPAAPDQLDFTSP